MESKKIIKKKTGLSLSTKKDDNFDKWYTELVKTSGMIRTNCDNSGRLVFWREAMFIWNVLTRFSSGQIESMRDTDVYFPSLGTEDEDEHVERFPPEVLWAGHDKMDCPMAITSFCSVFKQEIRSVRNLPFRCYTSGSAARWETGPAPIPFIRSVEFLWQEGHTAYSDRDQAEKEVSDILKLYQHLYQDYLAIPVVTGKKSENETFPGAVYSVSVEVFVPIAGRCVQGGACHSLGQNYAKMFSIGFQNAQGEKVYVWQNTWAFNTRAIGAMVMVHGDNKGIRLPPRVARIQVIVIPTFTKGEQAPVINRRILDTCTETVKLLKEAGIRAEADNRPNYTPGWKHNDWEMKGIPLRIVIGESEATPPVKVLAVRGDNCAKSYIAGDVLEQEVKATLKRIQNNLHANAVARRNARIELVENMVHFQTALDEKRLILAPWCDEKEVEQEVTQNTGAKTLCTPFDEEQQKFPPGKLCFATGKPAKIWSYWGKTF